MHFDWCSACGSDIYRPHGASQWFNRDGDVMCNHQWGNPHAPLITPQSQGVKAWLAVMERK